MVIIRNGAYRVIIAMSENRHCLVLPLSGAAIFLWAVFCFCFLFVFVNSEQPHIVASSGVWCDQKRLAIN